MDVLASSAMRHMGMVVMVGLMIGCLACEESEQPKEQSVAAAQLVPAASRALEEPPTPVEPAPEPEVEKPKKKLEDCPAEVAFANETYEMKVRVKAQKLEGKITTADLGRLRSLNLTEIPLDELDICLFHHMTNLRELFIGPGKVTDLSPLSRATKLESLGVSGNAIADLSPLAAMTKMDRLDLSNTRVTDLTPLEKMTSLTELMLDGTPVTDIGALGKMPKLERLGLKNTKVESVDALKDSKDLKVIYIEGSPLYGTPSALGPVRRNGTRVLP